MEGLHQCMGWHSDPAPITTESNCKFYYIMRLPLDCDETVRTATIPYHGPYRASVKNMDLVFNQTPINAQSINTVQQLSVSSLETP